MILQRKLCLKKEMQTILYSLVQNEISNGKIEKKINKNTLIAKINLKKISCDQMLTDSSK